MDTPGAKEVIESFTAALNGALVGSRVYERELALKKSVYTSVWLDVSREGFRTAILHVCQLEENPHFTVITPVDRGESVELIYHFSLFCGQHLKALALAIRVTLSKADLSIPTITDVIPGAIFSEREVQEMMGIRVTGIPDPRRLFIPEDFPQGVYPWRRDETGPQKMLRCFPANRGYNMSDSVERTSFTIPVGPVHPALHEPIRFDLTIDGEEVLDADVFAGQVHRGIEWIGMNRNNPVQTVYLAERVCGICSACHPFAFVQAVEMAAGIEVPPRAEYIRVIIAEIERIHSHLLWAGVAGHEIGFETLFYYVWRAREKVMDLTELLTGNRNSKAMFQIGGVRRDITPDQIPVIREALNYYLSIFDEVRALFLDDPTVKMRTRGVAIISTEDARQLCIVGPTARASGVPIDTRQDHAYSAYADLGVKAITPDVLTGEVVGDVYDRIVVRLLEVKQSIELIEKCIVAMPEGPLLAEPKIAKLLALLKKAEGEAVARVEAPRGENLHYVRMKAGDEALEAWKIRAPTYANLQSVKTMLVGQQIADVPIALASLDPCMSCTNRAVVVDGRSRAGTVLDGEQLHALSVEKTRRLRSELARK